MIVPGSDSPLLLTKAGYFIQRSLRFRSSASAYLNRTPGSATNRKTWTWSAWVKRGTLTAVNRLFSASSASPSTDQDYNSLFFNASDQIQFGGNLTNFRITSAVYRDPSAWYHIVFVTDTTQATAANRFRLYVNGVEITAFGTANNPAQNTDLAVNSTIAHYTGANGSSSYFDGYLAEVNFIDGQALTPSSFGSTNAITGVWQPKKYTGTYGTNGFYLPFTDNSGLTTSSNTGLGKDFSGNSNYWVTNNISLTAGVTYDSMTDVPTLTSPTVANYCVLNPLSTYGANTFSNANLNVTVTNGTSNVAIGSIAVPTGKWYWEVTFTSGTNGEIGISDASVAISSSSWVSANGWTYYSGTGKKANNNVETTYGASYTTNDVIGVALDVDSGTLEFYKNGTSQGVAFNTGLTGKTLVPMVGNGASASAQGYAINFGQRPFSYTPPSGFKALNTFNLPDSTIKAGNKYMDATTYSGTGSAKTVTNSGSFQPDFAWIKNRNTTGFHVLVDAVRGSSSGSGGLAILASNATDAEYTANLSDFVTGFASNGVSVGANTLATYYTNNSSQTYVAWQWNAGGSTVTNTAGSITSSVRANPTAGFSIVTYTGTGSASATIGHGLGVTPKVIIVKNRTTAGYNWPVYHADVGNTKALLLNLTNAPDTNTYWNNTSPTSSVFTIGNVGGVNTNTNNIVAYCFSEIAGFSRFGSYTGNGSTDGPFVYCGFRPKFLLYKRTDTTGYDWCMMDTSRSTYNAVSANLFPNLSNAEGTSADWDFLSNGFKARTSGVSLNANNGTYIYMAFAENPFKNALAR